MAATIVFTDKQDGTGVTITVSGLVDTPLVVWYGANAMAVSGASFDASVTINADGDTDIAVDPGPYQAVAVENGTVVGVYSFRVSDSWEGTHYRCLQAVRNYVIAMALPMFPTDPAIHKVHKKPIRTKEEFTQETGGGIHGVHYWPLTEIRRAGDNGSQNVEYPVQIALIRSSGGKLDPDSEWLVCREQLGKALHKTALPAVTEIHTANLRPLNLYDSAFLQLDVNTMIVTCETLQCSVVS